MGLHSHEEVTEENLFQGFVHNHHVNDINHVIAHKHNSLSAPEQFSPFRSPMLCSPCFVSSGKGATSSVVAYESSSLQSGTGRGRGFGLGLRLQKAKGWLSAIVCRSAELVHGGLHYSYCRETRIEWLLYCLNTVRAGGVI